MKKLEELTPMEIRNIWEQRKDITIEVPLNVIDEKELINCSDQPQNFPRSLITLEDMDMINRVYNDIENNKFTYLILKAHFENGYILYSKLKNNNCRLDITWV